MLIILVKFDYIFCTKKVCLDRVGPFLQLIFWGNFPRWGCSLIVGWFLGWWVVWLDWCSWLWWVSWLCWWVGYLFRFVRRVDWWVKYILVESASLLIWNLPVVEYDYLWLFCLFMGNWLFIFYLGGISIYLWDLLLVALESMIIS